MPILREKLNFKFLLYEQRTYDMIKMALQELDVDVNIQQFEGGIFADEVFIPKIMRDKVLERIQPELFHLDQEKPLLASDEKGLHYANELFFEVPCNWGSRGAPFFWAHLARKFSETILPMPVNELQGKYLSEVYALGIPFGKDEVAYIDQFAHGGMSSGVVSGMFAEKALENLVKRLKQYNISCKE